VINALIGYGIDKGFSIRDPWWVLGVDAGLVFCAARQVVPVYAFAVDVLRSCYAVYAAHSMYESRLQGQDSLRDGDAIKDQAETLLGEALVCEVARLVFSYAVFFTMPTLAISMLVGRVLFWVLCDLSKKSLVEALCERQAPCRSNEQELELVRLEFDQLELHGEYSAIKHVTYEMRIRVCEWLHPTVST